MEISQALQNAQSLDQVVAVINGGGTSSFNNEEIAAQYAWDAAEDNGEGMSTEEIEAHLDVLVEAGAEFDYQEALEVVAKAKKS